MDRGDPGEGPERQEFGGGRHPRAAAHPQAAAGSQAQRQGGGQFLFAMPLVLAVAKRRLQTSSCIILYNILFSIQVRCK